MWFNMFLHITRKQKIVAFANSKDEITFEHDNIDLLIYEFYRKYHQLRYIFKADVHVYRAHFPNISPSTHISQNHSSIVKLINCDFGS